MQEETFGFDQGFQEAIVVAALKDPVFLKQYEDVLLPNYFDYEHLTSIIRISRELTERLGEVPTKLTLVEEIKAFCEQFKVAATERNIILNKLEELYSTNHYDLEYIQNRVVEFGQRQSLRLAVLKIVTMIQSSRMTDRVYEESRGILEKALLTGMNIRDLGLDLYPNLERIPELAASSAAGLGKKIPTLFPTFDKRNNGGPGRGEVWMVVGLPGRGKSAFLTNIGAAALKSGYPVFHYTIGDLNEIDVAVRYAARLTMCTTYEVITQSEEYMKRARMMSKYNPHLYIKYFPSDTATMAHIRSHAARVRSIHEVSPAVTIIDYPGELKRSHKDNLYLSGGDVYSSMNQFANEFDSLVWAANQPTRWKAEHPKDVLKGVNTGESWKIFQKVDGAVTWNMDYEEEAAGVARLWVDKTRRAKSYYLMNMKVQLDRMLIQEKIIDPAPSDSEAS